MKKLNTINETNISIKKLDDAQRNMNVDICKVLENRKLCIKAGGSNCGFEEQGSRLMFIKMFSNNTDYKQVQLIFKEELTVEQYIIIVENYLETGYYKSHVANPMEIFVSKLLEEYKSETLYLDGAMLMEIDGEFSVDCSDIKHMEYSTDKDKCTLRVEEWSGEILMAEFILNGGTIKWTNENVEESPTLETGALTLDFLRKIVDRYNLNEENNWCVLGLISELLVNMDKESGEIFSLCPLDDMNSIHLKDGNLEIELTDGNYIIINKYGIEK